MLRGQDGFRDRTEESGETQRKARIIYEKAFEISGGL